MPLNRYATNTHQTGRSLNQSVTDSLHTSRTSVSANSRVGPAASKRTAAVTSQVGLFVSSSFILVFVIAYFVCFRYQLKGTCVE